MLDRRKFLTGATAGLFASTTRLPGINHVFAGETDTGSLFDNIIAVDNYIDLSLSTGSVDPVGIAWFIGLDISSSVTAPEYRAQLNVLADAWERDDFRESIFQHGGPGSAALFVADFDVKSKLQISGIDFRENHPDKFRHVANMIRGIERRNAGNTDHLPLLKNAMVCFDQMPWDCKRKYVNVMTDGRSSNTLPALKILAEQYGATVSAFTTRISDGYIIRDARQYLTTPPLTYRYKGEFVEGGTTKEVATELETQGDNIASYRDAVFLAMRRQILSQTASREVKPGTSFASAGTLPDPDRRNFWTAASKLTL